MAISPYKSPPDFTRVSPILSNNYSADCEPSSGDDGSSPRYPPKRVYILQGSGETGSSPPSVVDSSCKYFPHNPSPSNPDDAPLPQHLSPSTPIEPISNEEECGDLQQQPCTDPQVLYGQWLQRQRLLDPIPRPAFVWAIGILDISTVVLSIGLLVYDFFLKPFSDPGSQQWNFFVGCVLILMQLLMGVGLIAGLRSSDDSSTLWYCRIWIFCQYLFILQSVLFLFLGTILLGVERSEQDTLHYIRESFRFGYRVASLIAVKKFKRQLEKSQKLFELAWLQEQHRQELQLQQQQQQQQMQLEDSSAANYYANTQDQQRNKQNDNIVAPYVAVVMGF